MVKALRKDSSPDVCAEEAKPAVAKPVTEPTGSQWDAALKTMSSRNGIAIRVTEPDRRTRNRLKSTLQTIAKNRRLRVGIYTKDDSIYAWVIEDSN